MFSLNNTTMDGLIGFKCKFHSPDRDTKYVVGIIYDKVNLHVIDRDGISYNEDFYIIVDENGKVYEISAQWLLEIYKKVLR